MELLQLKYFQTVAQYEHMTKAANALYISQPSLSAMIAKLEEELGVQLFSRQGRSIVLNKYGRVFLRHVNRVFQQFDDAKSELDDLKRAAPQQIRIASTTTLLFKNWFLPCLQIHPDLRLRQKISTADEIERELLSGDIDFAILLGELSSDKLDSCVLWRDRAILMVPPAHPLANAKSAPLAAFKDAPFIGVSKDAKQHRMADRFCAQVHFKPKFIFEGDVDLMTDFLQLQKGVVFALDSNRASYAPYLVPLYLEDIDDAVSVRLFWRKDRYLSAPFLAFKNFLAHYRVQAAAQNCGQSYSSEQMEGQI